MRHKGFELSSRPRKRSPLLAASIAVLVLAALLFTLNLILVALGGLLITADPLEPSQVVVVLSGGRGDRVDEAALILKEKNAERLVLTHPETEQDEHESSSARRQAALSAGIPGSDILITAVHGNSTFSEANEIRRFLEERGVMSALIVTDPYHSFRTRLIFHEIFQGSEVDVYVRPVRNHWYRSTTWWTRTEGWQVTILEYGKLLAFLFGMRDG